MDSQCVLHWLQSKKPLSVFVTNRVKEIKFLEGMSIRYVPTEENQADLATRGKSPSELMNSIWWNGPHWLSQTEDKWLNPKIPEDNTQAQEFSLETGGAKVMFEAKLLVEEDPKGKVIVDDPKGKAIEDLLQTLKLSDFYP